MSKFQTWDEFEKELNFTPEEEAEIQFEMSLIDAEIALRKKKKLTQEDLSNKSGIKQSALARIEGKKHSPRVNTLIKLLAPMGYTIKIVPIDKKK